MQDDGSIGKSAIGKTIASSEEQAAGDGVSTGTEVVGQEDKELLRVSTEDGLEPEKVSKDISGTFEKCGTSCKVSDRG